MMSKETADLAQAERHLVEYRQRIADQERRILELQRDGHSTEEAEKLLAEFRETQRLGEEHRELILLAMARQDLE
jgi:hypothetical protein